MGKEAPSKTRSDYLFACGLALVAAVVGIAIPAAADGAAERPRLELVVVGLAALGIFGWVLFSARRGDAESAVPDLGHAAGRMRKMTFLWLALAAALGVSVMRAPISAVIHGTAGELPALSWLGLAAGLAVSTVAAWRFATGLRRRAGDG